MYFSRSCGQIALSPPLRSVILQKVKLAAVGTPACQPERLSEARELPWQQGVKRTLGSRAPGETKRLKTEVRYLKKIWKGEGEDLRDRDRRRTAWQKKQQKHGRARKDSKRGSASSPAGRILQATGSHNSRNPESCRHTQEPQTRRSLLVW